MNEQMGEWTYELFHEWIYGGLLSKSMMEFVNWKWQLKEFLITDMNWFMNEWMNEMPLNCTQIEREAKEAIFLKIYLPSLHPGSMIDAVDTIVAILRFYLWTPTSQSISLSPLFNKPRNTIVSVHLAKSLMMHFCRNTTCSFSKPNSTIFLNKWMDERKNKWMKK